MAKLEDLPKKDLELIADGKFDDISEEAKLAVSQIGQPAPKEKPGIIASGLGGVLGREEHAGLSLANIAEELGQSAGPILGGMKGAAEGAALGAPFGPPGVFIGGAVGAGAGAGAGRLAQTGLQDIASKAGSGVPIKPVGEAIEEATTEGAVATAFGVGIPALGKGVLGAGKVVGKSLGKYTANITPQSFSRMVSRPREVLAEMWKAIDTPEAVKEWGNVFKEAIKTNMEEAATAYEDIVKKQITENPLIRDRRFNLLRGLGDKMSKIKQSYRYGKPNQTPSAESESSVFNHFNNKIQNSKSIDAVDVYNLQLELNEEIRRLDGAKGKEKLLAALEEVHKELREYYSPKIPGLSKANSIYEQGKKHMNVLRDIEQMEDLPGKVKSAFKRNTTFKDKLNGVADGLPAASAALESLRDSLAGAEFATGRSTGLGGGDIRSMIGRTLGMGTSMTARIAEKVAPLTQSQLAQIMQPVVPGVGAAETERRLSGR